MEKKEGYKKTKIGWVPEDWEMLNLGKLVSIISGNSPDFYGANQSIGKYPFLKVEDLNNCLKYQHSSRFYTNKKENLTPQNSIIFPKRGAAIINNKVRINKVKVAMDSNLMALIPKNREIVSEFLYYSIIFQKLYRIADTSTIPQINNKHINPYKISLPSSCEQTIISQCLSTWDHAIHALTKLIQQKQKRKKWLMQVLLTGKKRLPGFDDEWEKSKFFNIAERITRKNNELNNNVVTISAQRGFVRQEEFFSKRVASDTLANYYLLHKGEFAYNKSYSNGYPMGAFKRLENYDKAVVTTLYICFRIRKGTNTDFIKYYFESGRMISGLMKIAQEGGRAHGLLNISLHDFFSLDVNIPGLKEQTAIAQVLQTADKEIEILNQKLDLLKAQKKGLMQQLLTGRKRLPYPKNKNNE